MAVSMKVLVAALYVALWGSEGLAAASTSSASFSSLQSLAPNSSLFALHAGDAGASAVNWRVFEREVLSDARRSPVTLLFVESERGIGCEDVDEREWGERELFPSPEADEEAEQRLQECRRRAERHQLALQAVLQSAKTRSTPLDPIVVVPRDKLPQAFDYHRVKAAPSMLWVPPRSARGFQRFPLAGVNFLDMSTETSPLVAKKFESVEKLQMEVDDFMYQSHVKSGYKSGKATPTSMASHQSSSGPGLFELLPVLLIAVFVLLVISEHRDAVFAVVQMRAFWFFISVGVVYISLSGIFYTIINKAAPLHFSPQHGFVFVYPSSRRQFALEGMVHGGWSLVVSVAVLAIVEVLPRLKPSARDDMLRGSLLAIGAAYTIVYFAFLSKYRWMAMP